MLHFQRIEVIVTWWSTRWKRANTSAQETNQRPCLLLYLSMIYICLCIYNMLYIGIFAFVDFQDWLNLLFWSSCYLITPPKRMNQNQNQMISNHLLVKFSKFHVMHSSGNERQWKLKPKEKRKSNKPYTNKRKSNKPYLNKQIKKNNLWVMILS